MIKKFIVILFLIGVLLLPALIFAQSTIYITKEDYPAAFTIKALDRFMDCWAVHDTVCMARLVTSGEVLLLKPGIEVYKIGHKFPGYTEIRPRGYTTSLWTIDEAIKKKE